MSTFPFLQMFNPDTPKITCREHSPPTQLVNQNPLNVFASEKKIADDELKLDIHIFSINEMEKNKSLCTKNEKYLSCHSIKVQTQSCESSNPIKMRNVSTQHRTRVQKLPRSFGTLTVTPWSGTAGQVNDDAGIEYLKETKKNPKGVHTVPFSSI